MAEALEQESRIPEEPRSRAVRHLRNRAEAQSLQRQNERVAMKGFGLLALAMLGATPAMAADLRDLCSDRPGLDTPPCTVDAGHVQVEMGIADWTRDTQPDSRTDTTLLGDTLVRIGVGRSTEVRIGWTPYGIDRERDRATGAVRTVHRSGDVTLGITQNLVHPDGKGFSIAVLPSVSVPVGREPIGAGTWQAGVLIPVSWELGDSVQLLLTPEIDAAADADGRGRHLAFGTAAGVSLTLTKTVHLSLEVEAIRDRDPANHQTQALAGASLAFQLGDNVQIDVGGNAGLNHVTADVEAYCGITRRF